MSGPDLRCFFEEGLVNGEDILERFLVEVGLVLASDETSLFSRNYTH